MSMPFRDNPPITTNWTHLKDKGVEVNKTKKAYYEISASKKPGKLDIILREEKKRLGGSAEREEWWFAYLSFDLDSTFAKDLKMFLNEYVKEEAPEEKNVVRIYFEKEKWCARLNKDQAGFGDSIKEALADLSKVMEVKENGN